jgi:hypothetical protein
MIDPHEYHQELAQFKKAILRFMGSPDSDRYYPHLPASPAPFLVVMGAVGFCPRFEYCRVYY